eukprot:TRINITY_DN4670_c0_g1_i3.p1 TRINITY_DN4670_c0_g1~~TRINITY_DN4670_c0_g1_i3.p1  ORF type:complete len:555 (+),score=130.81 TRINITY_DN4670_c0_g1_i3:60-1724(+)
MSQQRSSTTGYRRSGTSIDEPFASTQAEPSTPLHKYSLRSRGATPDRPPRDLLSTPRQRKASSRAGSVSRQNDYITEEIFVPIMHSENQESNVTITGVSEVNQTNESFAAAQELSMMDDVEPEQTQMDTTVMDETITSDIFRAHSKSPQRDTYIQKSPSPNHPRPASNENKRHGYSPVLKKMSEQKARKPDWKPLAMMIGFVFVLYISSGSQKVGFSGISQEKIEQNKQAITKTVESLEKKIDDTSSAIIHEIKAHQFGNKQNLKSMMEELEQKVKLLKNEMSSKNQDISPDAIRIMLEQALPSYISGPVEDMTKTIEKVARERMESASERVLAKYMRHMEDTQDITASGLNRVLEQTQSKLTKEIAQIEKQPQEPTAQPPRRPKGDAPRIEVQADLPTATPTSPNPPAVPSSKAPIATDNVVPVKKKEPLLDYASTKNGGRIYHGLFQPLYGLLPLSKNEPGWLLIDDMRPGKCWGFPGSSSSTIIQLGALINVEEIVVAHTPLSNQVSPTSAPREFSLLSIGLDGSERSLGTFFFDPASESLRFKVSVRLFL